MWVLEASGEILRGKRMWLRPGKQYLFGRVKKDGVRFAIDHKTVSRKHFVIEIADVASNEVSQIHSRTKVTIIDQNSKSGTQVNGEQLKGSDFRARELKQAKNSVRPGTLDQELLITWVPCVITYNMQKKEIKAGALKAKQDRLKHLGVKVVIDFVSNGTTHVVSTKRNTIKGLQALICGKHLVNDSFVEALELQVTPSTLSQEENPSQLELDFDGAWPQERDHLPAPGKEPTLRSADTYFPGPDRTHIFENYTFIFLEQAQHENLLAVISTGHGKALSFEYIDGQTTVEDALDFIAKAAGQKSFGGPHPRSAGGVVMVRWNKKPDEYSNSEKNFIDQVALNLDQRIIEQSELLDAILANDASLLRQPVPLESLTEGLRAPPPSTAPSFAPLASAAQLSVDAIDTNDSQTQRARRHGSPGQQTRGQSQTATVQHSPLQNAASTQHATTSQLEQNGDSQPGLSDVSGPQPPAKRPRYRAPTQIKFDDDFDPEEVVPFDDDDDDIAEAEPSPIEDSEHEPTPVASPQRAQISSRKRRRSPSASPEDAGAGMEDLLPAATAMKKQRQDFQEDLRRQGQRTEKSTTIVAAAKPRRKELDVREAMKRQREREKSRANKDDSEEEPVPPPDPDIREPADLAVVEYIDVPIRQRFPKNKGRNPEDDPRWDPRWNGRKNFKKFQPQEKGASRRPDHANKIMVQLIPMMKKKSGIGEEYWDRTTEEREREKKDKRKREKRRAQDSLSQSQGHQSAHLNTLDDDSDEDSFRTGRGRSSARPSQHTKTLSGGEEDDAASRASPATTRLREEAAALLEHEIDLNSPRRTRGDDIRTQTQTATQHSSRPSSSAGTTTKTARGTKRPASSVSSTATSKKRQKTLPVQEENSGEDSDDMKFRFGKGKGRKGRA